MIKRLTLFTVTAILAASCQSTNSSGITDGEDGTLSLSLNPTSEIVEVSSTKVSDYVVTSDFKVDIVDSYGTNYVSYASYDDVPSQIKLPEGKYTVVAETDDFYSAAYDSPYFYGSDDIAILSGSSESMEIVCAIGNVKVSVDYSDELLTSMENIVVVITSKYDASDLTKIGVLKFEPVEDGAEPEYEAGWYAVPYNGELDVYVSAKNKNTGTEITTTSKLQAVTARQWRKVTVDLTTSGSIGLDITIDDTLEEQDDVDVMIPDNNDIIDNNGDNGNWDSEDDKDEDPDPSEPQVDPVPTVEGMALGTEALNSSFDIDEIIYFKITEGYDKLDVLMKSTAEGGFTALKLKIESDALTDLLAAIGITDEIDLANPDTEASWYGLFCTLGIINTKSPIVGKTEHTFSVGSLMSLLWEVIQGQSTQDDTHLFHLTPVDANGETPITLSIILQ